VAGSTHSATNASRWSRNAMVRGLSSNSMPPAPYRVTGLLLFGVRGDRERREAGREVVDVPELQVEFTHDARVRSIDLCNSLGRPEEHAVSASAAANAPDLVVRGVHGQARLQRGSDHADASAGGHDEVAVAVDRRARRP